VPVCLKPRGHSVKKVTRDAIAAVSFDEENYQYIVDGIKMLSRNGYEIGEYNPHGTSAWLIQNDHTTCVVIGDHEQDACDAAADSGAWDSMKMSDEDYKEYSENGWDDSYSYAGNASEAFWTEHLYITKLITA